MHRCHPHAAPSVGILKGGTGRPRARAACQGDARRPKGQTGRAPWRIAGGLARTHAPPEPRAPTRDSRTPRPIALLRAIQHARAPRGGVTPPAQATDTRACVRAPGDVDARVPRVRAAERPRGENTHRGGESIRATPCRVHSCRGDENKWALDASGFSLRRLVRGAGTGGWPNASEGALCVRADGKSRRD